MKTLILTMTGAALIASAAVADEEAACPEVEYEVGMEVSVDHYGEKGLMDAIKSTKNQYQKQLETLKSEAKSAGVTLGRAESDDYSLSSYNNGEINQYDIDFQANYKVVSGGDKLEKLYVSLAEKGVKARVDKAIYTHGCED